jgi:hypothetical protein
MSKVAIKGSSTGTATFTIESPATNTDRTLVLPDNAGTVLTSASALAAANLSGRVPAANANLGAVLQVVNATYSTATSTTSSTFSDTGITASITPTNSNSKILALVNVTGCTKTGTNTALKLRLLRGASAIATIEAQGGYTNTTTLNSIGSCSTSYLDSPATTSSTTYKVQFASDDNTGAVSICGSSSVSTITLMEIAA